MSIIGIGGIRFYAVWYLSMNDSAIRIIIS